MNAHDINALNSIDESMDKDFLESVDKILQRRKELHDDAVNSIHAVMDKEFIDGIEERLEKERRSHLPADLPCVQDNTGRWCAIYKPDTSGGVYCCQTKCGAFVVLPYGRQTRLPTCPECLSGLGIK
jgi:hypothetical protein